jgi:nitrate/nitrite transporter NarK
VLLAAAGMQALAASSTGVPGLALSAVVLGSAYGAAAPASTHLLAPRTPKRVFNMIMSLRQIGVPLGGVVAALALPPLVPLIGWRGALLAEMVPVILLVLAMEVPRQAWDQERDPRGGVWGKTLLQPFVLLRDPRFARLSVACFLYSGLQLCLVAFMTVHLTTAVGFDLIRAGQVLAVYQVAGSLSRPVWGWVADRFLTPGRTLALHGAGMTVSALLTAQFGPAWPVLAIFAVSFLAGCTAGGYTGVAYAEYASLGGSRRTEATGLGTAIMFSGGLLIPPAFGALVTMWGGYVDSYRLMAVLALLCGLLMWKQPREG